jgi:hypothetical protein
MRATKRRKGGPIGETRVRANREMVLTAFVLPTYPNMATFKKFNPSSGLVRIYSEHSI